MDLSSYTPIYVRTTGSDANDGLSSGNAKLTAQAAYDTALAHGGGTGNKVLDIGAGTFAGIVLAANWPVRIAVRGAGATSSFLGGINGAGAWETSGFNIQIVSDNTVNVGAISTTGGSSWSSGGGNGGTVSLTDSVAGAISTSGGDGGGDSGGSGGSVTLANSTSGTISTTGGISNGFYYGAAGGIVSLTESTSGNIATTGGSSSNSDGGYGGAVTVENSTAGEISSYGGMGGTGGTGRGGEGGAIVLTNASLTGGADCSGGSGITENYSSWNGSPGSVTINGHFIPRKSNNYGGVVFSSSYTPPDILGTGLL